VFAIDGHIQQLATASNYVCDRKTRRTTREHDVLLRRRSRTLCQQVEDIFSCGWLIPLCIMGQGEAPAAAAAAAARRAQAELGMSLP
jgi:hypothetical protein